MECSFLKVILKYNSKVFFGKAFFLLKILFEVIFSFIYLAIVEKDKSGC